MTGGQRVPAVTVNASGVPAGGRVGTGLGWNILNYADGRTVIKIRA